MPVHGNHACMDDGHEERVQSEGVTREVGTERRELYLSNADACIFAMTKRDDLTR